MAQRDIVIVTGASRAIGAAISLAFARIGFDVAPMAHKGRPELDRLTHEAEKAGATVRPMLCDIRDAERLEHCFRAAVSERRLASLVNCAAFSGARAPLLDTPIEELDQVLEITLRGALLASRAAAEIMVEQGERAVAGGPSIVNISSQSAIFGGSGLAAYAAAKGGVNALTFALAREFGPHGVRVNAISPGPVDSEAMSTLAGVARDKMIDSIPIGRLCAPAYIADMAVWLASEKARYVNGVVIPMHGGR